MLIGEIFCMKSFLLKFLIRVHDFGHEVHLIYILYFYSIAFAHFADTVEGTYIMKWSYITTTTSTNVTISILANYYDMFGAFGIDRKNVFLIFE